MVIVPLLVTVAPELMLRLLVASTVAVPLLTRLSPLTGLEPATSQVAPLATVTVPGPSKFPPLVVIAPVTVNAPVPLTEPWTSNDPVEIELAPVKASEPLTSRDP